MPTRIMIIEMTIINSRRVKPERRKARPARLLRRESPKNAGHGLSIMRDSPIRIPRSVERGGGGFRIDIEDVFPAPGHRIRVIRNCPKTPFCAARDGIHRHAPQ